MIKSNDSRPSTRSFFLFEKALIVCKAKGNYYNYKETIPLSDYTIEDPQTSSVIGGGPGGSSGGGGGGQSGILSLNGPNGSLASSSSSNLGSHVGILTNLIQSNLSSINPNLSSSSINLTSSSQATLFLVNIDNPSKTYQLIFKVCESLLIKIEIIC